ncbi:pentatricopeptide repeat-containing protein [Rosa sericea]
MVSRQIQALIQRSKSAAHLLQLHSLVLKTGLDHNPKFVSDYINAASSISIGFAKLAFGYVPKSPPPLFAWNSIIRAFAKSPAPIESVKFFFELRGVGLKPDNFTYPFVVKACGRCKMAGVGGLLHCLIMKGGFDSDRYIGNALFRMYADCGAVGIARKVFDEMPMKDVVSWSSLIAGYVACNYPLEALRVFREMKLADEKPNSVTLVSLLSACTRLHNISTGKSIHCYIIVHPIEIDVVLGTALIEMYSKCGHVEKAFHIFNSMSEKNLQSWTIMMCGLADHGRGNDAILLFSHMEQAGLVPDSMAFSAILSACSHVGLLNEGRQFFNQMVRTYNIEPTMEHYGCLVDLLGRAGLIEEAYEVIKNMPMEPNSVMLRSFLGACRNHNVVFTLDDKFRKVLTSESHLGANYVLAANLSSVSGCWSNAADLRLSMKQKGVVKVPGCSWVEVGGSSSGDILKETVR